MMPTVVSSESAPQTQRRVPTMRSDVRREAAPDKSKATGAEPPNTVSGATPCSIDGTRVPAMSSPGFVAKTPSGSALTASRNPYQVGPGPLIQALIASSIRPPPGDKCPREAPRL